MIGLLNLADAMFRDDPIAGALIASIVILSLAVVAKITIDALWGGQ